MTVAQTPGALLGAEVGLDDSQWIADVRDALEDRPTPLYEQKTADGQNGTFGAASLPYRVTRPRINDNTGGIKVAVGGANYPISATNPPTAGQVYVDYDIGALYFATPPSAATSIQVEYYSVRWRDSSILTALVAGMRNLFPKFGKAQTDSTQVPQIMTWEYNLPTWLQTPGARLLQVECRDPDTFVTPWRTVDAWERSNGLLQVKIYNAQAFSQAGRWRFTGWGPYAQLRDLEPQLYHLVIWYALGALLLKKEGPRIRDDRAQAQSQEGALPPGEQTKLGAAYMNQFWSEMDRMPKLPAPGYRLKLLPSYARRFR